MPEKLKKVTLICLCKDSSKMWHFLENYGFCERKVEKMSCVRGRILRWVKPKVIVFMSTFRNSVYFWCLGPRRSKFRKFMKKVTLICLCKDSSKMWVFWKIMDFAREKLKR